MGDVVAAALVADIDAGVTVREADCCGLRPFKRMSAEEESTCVARATSNKGTCPWYMVGFGLRLE